jgi:4-hydroxybenzoate polyprenyltransferase
MRLRHWSKGIFILLPLPFAWAAGARFGPGTIAIGLLAFSLCASGVYALNDARDAEADRVHPRKRSRPVARGAISPAGARGAAAALIALGLTLLGLAGGREALLLGALYLATNLTYSLGAREAPLLDVFLLASGYVIRVLLGCALARAPASAWLLGCASALALFLSFAKRRADLVAGLGEEVRGSLSGYSVRFLDQAMALCAGVSLLAYALYCIEARVMIQGRELAGMPFVAFGILDYLRRAFVEGAGAFPVEELLGSRRILLAGLAYLLATAWSLGLLG